MSSPVMQTVRLRNGREMSEMIQMNLRAGWKLVVKLIKLMSSAWVQEVAPMKLSI